MPLAEVTVHVFGFINFGFCANELKNFCDMTDKLGPVSKYTVVVPCCTVMEYSALNPLEEASFRMASISLNSQSKLEDIKSAY